MKAERIHTSPYRLAAARAKGERTMTEASGDIGRAEIERKLIQRSMEDEDFRRRLLEDPKGTLEQELGRVLPEGVQVRVAEESADTIYLVLPSTSPLVSEGGKISDRDLEDVAGGASVEMTEPTGGNSPCTC